jgi:hypothetical protein
VFSGSSGGILPLLQLQLRPWQAIPRDRLAVPTPPARAITIAMLADSRRNVTQPGTSWRSSPNRPGLPSSSGSINENSCSRPSTVSPAIRPVLISSWTNYCCSVTSADRVPSSID